METRTEKTEASETAMLRSRVDSLKKQNREFRQQLEKYALEAERLSTGLNMDLKAAFEVLNKVAQGDFSARLREDSPNEYMLNLSRTVNHMVDSLQSRDKELASRSSALEEANSRLQATQELIMSLSTPVVELWEGVLALPLVGVLDSSRAQQAMEVLLQETLSRKARTVLVDITGVPLVDSMVASHLVQTMAALKLVGADGILTGISASVARTLVQLGVDFTAFETKATLAEGFAASLRKTGKKVENKA